MTEIFTARTVDEAKQLAAEKFGKPVSEIKFEIIEEGKKGFLGIGKTDAKIKAVYEEAVCSEIKSDETVSEDKTVEVIDKITENETDVQTAPTEKIVEDKTKTDADVNSESSENDEYSVDNFTVIEDDSLVHPKVKIARDYITGILRAMGVNAEFKIYQNDTGAIINIESDNNGTVIGRRGETIDAIQYLCSIIANKGDKEYFRITVDCYGYRKKRRETLEQLAAKVARSAIKTGRSQPLEPMNPYERRVIHSAISKIEGVSSRSVGEEPYRKIIISSNNPKKGGNFNGKRRNDNHRNNGKNHRAGRREPFESRDIDLSTSFEKDYKKPKPEDNIDTGLYGKIEF